MKQKNKYEINYFNGVVITPWSGENKDEINLVETDEKTGSLNYLTRSIQTTTWGVCLMFVLPFGSGGVNGHVGQDTLDCLLDITVLQSRSQYGQVR